MKILIFLIILVIVGSWWFWNWRKTQAEAEIIRRQTLEKKRKQKKETMEVEGLKWPTVGPSADSELEEAAEIDGPSMTAIEFVPPEKMT